MVFVPAQDTSGNDPNALPEGFFVYTTEVTVRDYAKCVSARVCTEAHFHGAQLTTAEYLRSSGQCNALYADRAQYPVNCIDLGQAATYCRFVVKRLPSSKEWGFVARGSDERMAPWGNDAVDCDHAVGAGCVFLEAGRSGAAPVGSRAAGASPLGVFDLLGNVAEWVWDGALVPSGQASPVGVLRGGAWNVALSDLSVRRGSSHAARDGGPDTGFRCVKGGASAVPVDVPQGLPFDCSDACERECLNDADARTCTDACTRTCAAGSQP
jgi:formylglycine-generating enzyme required for sulfatase activity